MSEDNSSNDRTAGTLALARMFEYCETEARALNLPFVAYCLSLAMGALAERVDDFDGGWATRLRGSGD